MRNPFRSPVDPLPDPEESIRTELFSVERLEQHAETLAAAQRVTADPRRGRALLPRLVDNGRVLLASYRTIAESIRDEHAITPAAGWLVDNFHIVDEQLRQIREDLPPGYYRKLPKLAGGFLEGYPRVFGIAWAFVAHTDSRFEPEALRRFVQAYQRVQPLTIGELWAVAITLRIVMVENLRRIAERLVQGRLARREADALADRLLGLGGRAAPEPAPELARFAQGPLPTAFAVQLVQRLREQDPDLVTALRWLEEKLASQGTTSEDIVRREHHRQSAMNVTVRNLITSMRLMSTIDWKEFFESVSPVDEVLRGATNFAALDFATRDLYRHVIEDLSRGSLSSEVEVARLVVRRAQAAAAGDAADQRSADPGFHLAAEGRAALEQELHYRVPPERWVMRAYLARAVPTYVSTVALLSALLLVVPMLYSALTGAGPLTLLLLAVLAFVPTTDLAVALANLGVVQRIGPRALPKLELREGVPADLRTLVVMPVLLSSEGEVDELIAQLEIHHLANPDRELAFALLSDWTDAPSETMPDDERLVLRADAGIARLEARHGTREDGVTRFHLFHRARRWNASEGKWMGWERKRGKLHELNQLLRGATDTSFVAVGGRDPRPPARVRYVITLDADTRLPVGAARALIGTMAHPLNRARFDAELGRVVEGYGVLQPRVSPTLPSDREGSLYQWISAGPCGIDPYVSAVSDVYQDLFAEGSYTGKGIYDVDAFEAALAGRVPENAMLSHDLFEGVFARAGLSTAITFFEAFPTHYQEAAQRQHRWARGDWQLLPWIFGARRGTVPFLGRWKMADNLRRTLSAPMAVLTLVAAWLAGGELATLWSRFILAVIALPALLPLVNGIVPRRRGISKRSHLRGIGEDLVTGLLHVALTVTMLAHQASLMTDAIARTLVRLFVTRRRFLEWVTAAQARLSLGLDLRGFYRRMRAAVGLALVVLLLIVLVRPESWSLAAPFLLLWVLSPLVAQRISLPPRALGEEPLSAHDESVLRLAARRTWQFFVTFVGEEDNALPPDNFQEDPKPVVAHRTSPTNIGLYCLATIAARDFAWLGVLETTERLEATFATLARMERFRGHFYNWYDTRTLAPLEPPYVSSVDSGNLAGHLIVIAQACQALMDRPVLAGSAATGIRDALGLVREAAAAIPDDRRTEIVTGRQLDDAIEALAIALGATPAAPAAWARWLEQLGTLSRTLVDITGTLDVERGDGAAVELSLWSRALAETVASHARDLEVLLPWAGHDETADGTNGLLDTIPAPSEMSDRRAVVLAAAHVPAGDDGAAAFAERLDRSAEACSALVRRLVVLARAARELFEAMAFDFLFDPTRDLLAIGYRVREVELDPNCYDLLASEARLASFVAIAKGDVPTAHWFHLGRSMTPVDRGAALISWSGSMFEYLMPSLVMRAPQGSLLEQTCRFVVRRQIAYGASRGVPWGVSESAFNARDLELTYQYSNFGVPGLGLKRGLSEDLVVAPYATALAAMIDPRAAVANLDRLATLGARGRYGFYEALDYTVTRLPEGSAMGLVRAYMAHHQGMSVVAIANVLHDGEMRARFHAEPIVTAADLLLQERAPRDVAVSRPRAEEVKAAAHVRDLVSPVVRRFTSVREAVPRTHLLSNDRYAVMITTAGSGYSRWGDLAITRWREDVTRDAHGQYVFLRDTDSGEVWSAGHQPSGVEPDSYEAVFSEDRAEIRRRDGAITTRLEVVVSPEDDAEVRRITITNLGSRPRQIELTSYAEIVLATPAADAAHPVFSNLFVQTEADPALHSLFATRRPRSPEEPQVWAAHVVTVDEHLVGGFQYETDRARFLGRGRGIRTPMSVIDGRPLSNTAGSVLDPIFSLRTRVRLASGTSARVTFSTLVGASRDNVVDLADKYRDPATFERVVTLARTEAQVQLRHLGIAAEEAHLFQRLANRVLYADSALRPGPDVLRRASGGASGLWPHGISGDLPIVLVRIDAADDQEIVHQLLRAHEYWRLKQLAVDLVIVNEQGASYAPELQGALEGLVRTSQSKLGVAGAQGGHVFILRGDRLPAGDRLLLQTTARAVLLSRHGTLVEQVNRVERLHAEPVLPPARRTAVKQDDGAAPARHDLELFNGLGGFAEDGREYVTVLGEGQWTPAPWLNVIANPGFGFQVSESGSGYTWSGNSRENQLTAWSNDPVSDPPGEVLYVRDEESGALWGPTVLPIREDATQYIIRHGQGYSRFAHASHGIELELLQFVPLADSVKISRLELTNRSGRTRRLSVTAYVEWVLGTARGTAAPHIVTELDAASGAILVRNPWNGEFAERVAFADLGGRQSAWTCDRTEFLGRNGSLDHPLSLERGTALAGSAGAGLDPCSALQATLELRDGARATVLFLLGEAANAEDARALVTRYRAMDVDAALTEVTTHWDDVLACVQVKTPDRSMDLLLNRWLLYQVLACRVWARSAFYQAGGAYGFRDQLQDVMALTVSQRTLAREHLLRAAKRQFVEGDVQHWWHPPSGRGTRTRISDDLLWLAYAVNHYLEVTADLEVLDEVVPFVHGPLLSDGQGEAYFTPQISSEEASLYEHCARALDRSLGVGSHGLPLMGGGDWNDGMNRVGQGGRGESVWLGWFLHTVLWQFARYADLRADRPRAEAWRKHVTALQVALEREAWDGDWYRRAYFDDGTPLGSVANEECRIDSIAQSWAVISGAADRARATRAMAAVEEYLVRRGDGLVLLFTPPFNHPARDPGYIQGYLPGVRENGGQYTHAAIWSVLAFAALGDGDKAGELFAILNPVNHTSTRAGVHRYKVEPYVAAADVYAEPPHVGRGGWTWYTGSAGWMHRAGIEWILGFRVRGATLHMDPCIPRAWPRYEISFRYHSAHYEIVVENPHGVTRGVSRVEVDGGQLAQGAEIDLLDDGRTHHVRLTLGTA